LNICNSRKLSTLKLYEGMEIDHKFATNLLSYLLIFKKFEFFMSTENQNWVMYSQFQTNKIFTSCHGGIQLDQII